MNKKLINKITFEYVIKIIRIKRY